MPRLMFQRPRRIEWEDLGPRHGRRRAPAPRLVRGGPHRRGLRPPRRCARGLRSRGEGPGHGRLFGRAGEPRDGPARREAGVKGAAHGAQALTQPGSRTGILACPPGRRCFAILTTVRFARCSRRAAWNRWSSRRTLSPTRYRARTPFGRARWAVLRGLQRFCAGRSLKCSGASGRASIVLRRLTQPRKVCGSRWRSRSRRAI